MNGTSLHIGKRALGRRGYSLVELLVVVAILGVLSVAVGVYINTSDIKLKSYAFNLRTRFQQAKFEAVKRNRDVYLDFDFDGNNIVDNGFTIWAENNGTAGYQAWTAADDANGDGICDYDEGKDCVIETIVFENKLNSDKNGPEIYNQAVAVGGPKDPGGGPDGATIGVGVSASSFRFQFRPNGESKLGTAYIYMPVGTAGAESVAAGPWAIAVSGVGRIRLRQWLAASAKWTD